jgi:hypothetical protein
MTTFFAGKFFLTNLVQKTNKWRTTNTEPPWLYSIKGQTHPGTAG